MKDQILNYSDFIDQVGYMSSATFSGSSEANFYFPKGKCKFCNSEMRLLDLTPLTKTENNLNFSEERLLNDYSAVVCSLYRRIFECVLCGWWQILSKFERYEYNATIQLVLRNGILYSYDLDGNDIPIMTLRDYLVNNPNAINSISPYKMEKLVQSVFKDFYDCEVIHCGGTNDGGIDLIIINSDNPIAVQVKRREQQSKSESVQTVRHFLGAIMLKGIKDGKIVSTTRKFSKQANIAARTALNLRDVNTFELQNVGDFLSKLNLMHYGQGELWKDFTKITPNAK